MNEFCWNNSGKSLPRSGKAFFISFIVKDIFCNDYAEVRSIYIPSENLIKNIETMDYDCEKHPHVSNRLIIDEFLKLMSYDELINFKNPWRWFYWQDIPDYSEVSRKDILKIVTRR